MTAIKYKTSRPNQQCYFPSKVILYTGLMYLDLQFNFLSMSEKTYFITMLLKIVLKNNLFEILVGAYLMGQLCKIWGRSSFGGSVWQNIR